ncbi:DUF3077 domain-containing protein [Pseudomonas sp. R5(2019)]|uniref:DUF3077 domain-containing protein n=1 Tax=Pseudomonas sp. R5(2019) TaxID=2697566 RepID=UPI001412766A|nr:DUF3077 domain-containing protein [Pseudomonas sp. R5(2019)]NBA94976.1 DUF3077 domain-containing protein [Pseudomonas sp. R5(2019)]
MKKTVPDPPLTSIKTVLTPFGTCDAPHGPLFAVLGGIGIHDALVHTSLYLRCVLATSQEAVPHTGEAGRGMLWSAVHSAEMAKALVDGLLDGLEAEQDKAGG